MMTVMLMMITTQTQNPSDHEVSRQAVQLFNRSQVRPSSAAEAIYDPVKHWLLAHISCFIRS